MADAAATVADAASQQRDALVTRLSQAGMGLTELATVYVGDRLGLYEALVATGPSTSAALAAETGTHERYVREWLEQQTVAGFLAVEDVHAAPAARRYTLPAAHRDVLSNRDSPFYLAAQVRVFLGMLRPLPLLLAAFRSGAGVPYAAYGADLHEGMGDGVRPVAVELLPGWLATLPDVHTRLTSDPPARVAEIGCGVGWDSIGVARVYPTVRVDGFDLDAPSIALAQANAVEAGVAERVTFQVRDGGDPALAGAYDVVIATITIHDTARPVEVLGAMRRLAGEQGTVLVVEAKVGDSLADDLHADNDIERGTYAFSVLHCLPVGMAEQPSAATGMVMRPATLRRYAHAAGFQDIEILPIESPNLRLYRLMR